MDKDVSKADIGVRILAFMIDFGTFSMILVAGIIPRNPFGHELVIIIIALLIFCMRDSFGGAGLGKRLLKVAVRCVDKPDLTPSLFKLFYRNIFIFVWPIEVLSLLWYERKMGDTYAGTDVYRIS